MKNKIIINLCPTGMVNTRKNNPNIPITPEEIIKDALECSKLGASIIHIHARDADGSPTWDKDVFAKIITGIREKNDSLILVATTSGRSWSEFEKRSDCLNLKGDLKPDMASLTLGSMNFINNSSVNEPDMIDKLALKMRSNNIKPELEVFEPGMINKAKYMISKGIISENKPYFNILLGSLGTSVLSPLSLASFLNELPDSSVWSLAGIGKYQLDANVMSLSSGGNIRIGLEDNLYMDKSKTVFASNVKLVERIVKIVRLMNLTIATPEEARKMLEIKKQR